MFCNAVWLHHHLLAPRLCSSPFLPRQIIHQWWVSPFTVHLSSCQAPLSALVKEYVILPLVISLERCHHSWRRLSFTSLTWVAQYLGGLSFVHSGEEQIMTGIPFFWRGTLSMLVTSAIWVLPWKKVKYGVGWGSAWWFEWELTS